MGQVILSEYPPVGPSPSSTSVSAIIQFPPDISVLGCVEVPIPESRLDTWSESRRANKFCDRLQLYQDRSGICQFESVGAALDYDAFLQEVLPQLNQHLWGQ